MLLALWIGILYAAVAYASYGRNLNYRSPSHHHAGLGISIRKVVKRSNPSERVDPSTLNFTHGIASGGMLPLLVWMRLVQKITNGMPQIHCPIP